ncbi:MAG: AI-2E family transporter [Elusimicrobia bacterium]|nr:AI-2E family transporter [Elusimicrobiota bacterium]
MDIEPKLRKLLKFDHPQIFSFFFFGILLFLLYQLLRVLSPFAGAIILAAMTTLIFYPLHLWINKRLIKNRTAAAAVSTLTAVITVILPLLFFGWLVMREARHLYPQTTQWLSNLSQNGIELSLPPQLRSFGDIDLQDIVDSNIQNLRENIMNSSGKLLKNIFFFAVNFIVLIAMLFVFFKDGEHFLHWLIDIIPMDRDSKHRVANQLYITTIAVVRGILLTAAIQGLTATVGYHLAGVASPTVLGMLTGFAALIPFVGTSLVWLPLGLFFVFYKSFNTGIFILAWGGLVVGLLDNFLRPILIGKEAKLPIFLLFLGIFGGIKVYGPLGIFLGPLLISCVIVFLQIYKETKKAASGSRDAGQEAPVTPGQLPK